MDIKQAKQELRQTVLAYTAKTADGCYRMPRQQQRPILLMGPPGIGKTAILGQIAQELQIGLVSYTMTHHTRQSALGLPVIVDRTAAGRQYRATEYTMSEIIAAVYEQMEKTGVKIVAKNSKAFHEYFVEERFEAGIELFGTEVKSIRLGTLNLKDAWCSVKDGELWVRQMHISPYEKGNIFNKDPIRPRRLLMHKREIQRLASKVQLDGYAIVPLSVYLKNSRVKVEVALCKGKKLYDKRQDAANKDARRQIDRAMKERNH